MRFQFAKTQKSLYLEASSEREVREYLKDRNYNIELCSIIRRQHILSMSKTAQISDLENA